MTVCAVTGVPDRFCCFGCGVSPMPDGNGGVIVLVLRHQGLSLVSHYS